MFGKYLSESELNGFDKYKYKSIDTSPISNYITHPFWNTVVEYFPKWLPPNVMTFSGWCCLVLICIVTSYYDPYYKAGSAVTTQNYAVPRLWWLLFAIAQFIAHTLDGCDGKQARRTNSSTPLGELFDHGLDSMAAWLINLAVMSMFGIGSHSITIQEFLFLYFVVLSGFYSAHWEKYNTGVLYLPWAYDASQLLIASLYLLLFFFGHDMFKMELFEDFSVSQMFRWGIYLSSFLFTFPMAIYNVYTAFKTNSARSISPLEGFMPLVPLSIMFLLFAVWAYLSPSRVYENQPRLFCVAVGIVFSNINCRLIVATMCGQSCDRFNTFLYPLMVILGIILFVPLDVTVEFYLLIIYTTSTGFAHLVYGISVVNELCDHLGIRCFSLKKP